MECASRPLRPPPLSRCCSCCVRAVLSCCLLPSLYILLSPVLFLLCESRAVLLPPPSLYILLSPGAVPAVRELYCPAASSCLPSTSSSLPVLFLLCESRTVLLPPAFPLHPPLSRCCSCCVRAVLSCCLLLPSLYILLSPGAVPAVWEPYCPAASSSLPSTSSSLPVLFLLCESYTVLLPPPFLLHHPLSRCCSCCVRAVLSCCLLPSLYIPLPVLFLLCESRTVLLPPPFLLHPPLSRCCSCCVRAVLSCCLLPSLNILLSPGAVPAVAVLSAASSLPSTSSSLPVLFLLCESVLSWPPAFPLHPPLSRCCSCCVRAVLSCCLLPSLYILLSPGAVPAVCTVLLPPPFSLHPPLSRCCSCCVRAVLSCCRLLPSFYILLSPGAVPAVWELYCLLPASSLPSTSSSLPCCPAVWELYCPAAASSLPSTSFSLPVLFLLCESRTVLLPPPFLYILLSPELYCPAASSLLSTSSSLPVLFLLCESRTVLLPPPFSLHPPLSRCCSCCVRAVLSCCLLLSLYILLSPEPYCPGASSFPLHLLSPVLFLLCESRTVLRLLPSLYILLSPVLFLLCESCTVLPPPAFPLHPPLSRCCSCSAASSLPSTSSSLPVLFLLCESCTVLSLLPSLYILLSPGAVPAVWELYCPAATSLPSTHTGRTSHAAKRSRWCVCVWGGGGEREGRATSGRADCDGALAVVTFRRRAVRSSAQDPDSEVEMEMS
ncbi:hypothetical protein C7M84_019766 [Penaeus vannamei]|uniref:Uncharacterized protein n=1 Tax=Penaeus vannamei TaxID=6689 RepID=A0A423SDW9_PENVA|nr:hypothetical protein C7M84_019766 [Penaeus vannamei]